MGFKLVSGVNAVPASYKDGKITYYIAGTAFTTKAEAKELDGFVFERQCNQFKGENISLYLKNDKYILILREDGTGCLVYIDGMYMYKSFRYRHDDLNMEVLQNGGSFKRSKSRDYSIVKFLRVDTDHAVLFSQEPWSFTLRLNENSEYKLDRMQAVGYPLLAISSDSLVAVGRDGNEVYKLKGELSISKDGFQYLGSVSWYD